jgi:hypothetical protein
VLRAARYEDPVPTEEEEEEDYRYSSLDRLNSFGNEEKGCVDMGDIPEELSALFNPLPLNSQLGTASMNTSDPRVVAGLGFLQELDKDYLQLRSKVVSFLRDPVVTETAEVLLGSQHSDMMPLNNNDITSIDEKVQVGISKARYWPPLARNDAPK